MVEDRPGQTVKSNYFIRRYFTILTCIAYQLLLVQVYNSNNNNNKQQTTNKIVIDS